MPESERRWAQGLRRVNFELRGANTILEEALVFFAQELDPNRSS